MGGGFRMGPFELMDLVGVDTGFEVSKSFYAQSFGEPRWRPSPITTRYVAAGLHGRKSGRGYYDYSATAEGGSYRSEDPGPIEAEVDGGEGVVVISGAGALASELREAATAAGYEVRSPHAPSGGVLPSLAIDCTSSPTEADGELEPGSGGAQLLLCARASLTRLDPGGSAVGFHALPPLDRRRPGRAHPHRELLARRGRPRRALLQHPRQARGVGRGRSRAGARADRLPGHQRGRLRPRRRGRQRRGHRPRHGTRREPSPGTVRVGRPDRPRARAGGAGGALRRVPRGALPSRSGAAPAGGGRQARAAAAAAASCPAAK